MLDPAVSAAIKKYGVFKWSMIEFPHLVFSAVLGAVGIGVGLYASYTYTQANTKTKYFYSYVVMRPDDPRLKSTIIWGDDGKPIN